MIILEEVTVIEAAAGRCFDLARSVEVHLLRNAHCGEGASAVGGVTTGLLELDDSVTWRARHFGIRWNLISRISAFDRPNCFQAVQVRGPFASMRHDHYFRRLAPECTEMRDVFALRAWIPFPGLRRYVRALLQERARVIRDVAESGEWRSVPGL